jgi:hypothetical protein
MNFLELVSILNPYYKKLNSKYSKSYVSGSIWYVGDDLVEWWTKICIFSLYLKKKQKLFEIIDILLKEDVNNELHNKLIE